MHAGREGNEYACVGATQPVTADLLLSALEAVLQVGGALRRRTTWLCGGARGKMLQVGWLTADSWGVPMGRERGRPAVFFCYAADQRCHKVATKDLFIAPPRHSPATALPSPQELPVWGSSDVEAQAGEMQRMAAGLGADAWALALALVLGDSQYVAAFIAAQPQVRGQGHRGEVSFLKAAAPVAWLQRVQGLVRCFVMVVAMRGCCHVRSWLLSGRQGEHLSAAQRLRSAVFCAQKSSLAPEVLDTTGLLSYAEVPTARTRVCIMCSSG